MRLCYSIWGLLRPLLTADSVTLTGFPWRQSPLLLCKSAALPARCGWYFSERGHVQHGAAATPTRGWTTHVQASIPACQSQAETPLVSSTVSYLTWDHLNFIVNVVNGLTIFRKANFHWHLLTNSSLSTHLDMQTTHAYMQKSINVATFCFCLMDRFL